VFTRIRNYDKLILSGPTIKEDTIKNYH